jgi:hypothetical protein
MSERYPGYDVLAKRDTPSWNAATRAAVDERLAVHPGPRFFTGEEWPMVQAVCARIVPQPADRPPVPLAAYVDAKLHDDRRDGYRRVELPPQREAWRRAVAALDAEARAAHARRFHEIGAVEQDALLKAMQAGELDDPAWAGMPPAIFFADRLLADITSAYYAHPTAWSEIGWGGPASPRGYVRMGFGQRDPWEAAEAHGDPAEAERRNRDVGRR